jgi:hypothetical protein
MTIVLTCTLHCNSFTQVRRILGYFDTKYNETGKTWKVSLSFRLTSERKQFVVSFSDEGFFLYLFKCNESFARSSQQIMHKINCYIMVIISISISFELL